MAFMLSVTNKPFKLSVVVLNVAVLSVSMLSVLAPFIIVSYFHPGLIFAKGWHLPSGLSPERVLYLIRLDLPANIRLGWK